MKPIRIIQSLALLALAGFSPAAIAQDSITVRLGPDSESTIVGKLESLSLAVNAEWPKNSKPVPGWKPIYYRGKFMVYLNSHEIGKDYSPLPGSRYLLTPSPDAQTLTIATDEDKAEIVSIDPRYCHINLETIILAYIEDATATVPTPSTPTKPAASSPAPSASIKAEGPEVTTLQGILVFCNAFELKNSGGYAFKILNHDNKTLAFLDTSKLPEFVLVKDYANAQVIGTGILKEGEVPGAPVLQLQGLKKKH